MKTVFFLALLMFLFSGLALRQSPPQKLNVCLTAEEEKLFKLINQYRKSKGLSQVPYSAALSKVAQLHAKDLETKRPHQTGNCNMHSWSVSKEWSGCCYTPDHKEATCMWNKPKELTYYQANGFEIASSYYNSKGAGTNAEQALTQWKGSPSHHDVILSRGVWKKIPWNAVGIGIYKSYAVVWFGGDPDPDNVIRKCK